MRDFTFIAKPANCDSLLYFLDDHGIDWDYSNKDGFTYIKATLAKWQRRAYKNYFLRNMKENWVRLGAI